MSAGQAAIRRRKQAAGGYRHLGPLVRPHYSKVSREVSQRRLAQLIATEQRIRMSGGKSKKEKGK